MTGQEAINRALRLIKVLPTGQTPSADETENCLMALNAMLTRWEANGLSMGFSPIASAGSTLPVPDESHDAIVYNLAVRVAPEFEQPVPPSVAYTATETLNDLSRDAMTIPRLDTGLPRTRGVFDINRGY